MAISFYFKNTKQCPQKEQLFLPLLAQLSILKSYKSTPAALEDEFDGFRGEKKASLPLKLNLCPENGRVNGYVNNM
ncbi:hypothetical protein DOE51_08140 [Bdellovibrio sp. NC01]|nr:hypothetical protein DOE51_08140 [Bdellovibrio sp. NC01]